jgi:lipoprotein-anchoring transpeptidase ErfK/SrfK
MRQPVPARDRPVEYRVGVTKPASAARVRRFWGVLAVSAASLGVLAACTTGSGPAGDTSASVPGTATGGQSSTPAPATSTPAPPTTSTPTPEAKPVHIKTANADGASYGVGMPIIAYFTKRITSAATLEQDTVVTADGQPVQGGWYFETSAAFKDYPIEGHWRPKAYWPPHSQIHVDMPMKGKSAGTGLAFDNNLTLDFSIGASHIVTVSNATHTLTVVADGKRWGTFPVSLGATKTPTIRGTKVIMEKGLDISMRGPGYYDPHVKYTQRLTYGGEYLHAAPWNTYNIDHGINSSNGCTNLHNADAKKLYDFLGIGDVVRFPDANGPRMQLGEGYGDWNVPWSQWQTGGLVPTT